MPAAGFFLLPVGDVSQKLGRGRHTTRHVELFYPEKMGHIIADTPGFSSFDTERMDLVLKEELAVLLPRFFRLSRKVPLYKTAPM
jgi:ribosome biogenesis GTPase